MKVGDYVRTKDGYIYKIEDGEEFYEDSVDVGIGTIPDVDGIWVDKEHFQYVDKRQIIKSSPNIIDLIEEDDYIRTINDTDFRRVYMSYGKLVIEKHGLELSIKKLKLAEIITSQQFSQMKYKVESEVN